jgi:hypothetical protein
MVCGGGSVACRREDNDNMSRQAHADTFDLRDPGTDRVIDVGSSFAPTGLVVLLWKMAATMFTFSVILVGLHYNHRGGSHAVKYFFFLSNWATVSSLVYFICSLVNSAGIMAAALRQPDNGTGQYRRPSRWVRFTWVMFQIAAHMGIVTSIAYWAYHFHTPKHKLKYRDVTTHGVVGLLVLLDGLVVNRIPIRLAHFWQSPFGSMHST